MQYAAGKLKSAVRVLAVGRPIIKDRLYDAYRELSPVMESDIPRRYRPTLRWIRRALTKKPPLYPIGTWDDEPDYLSGRLGSTLFRIKTAKAVQIATRLVDLADAVHEIAQDRQRRMREAWLRRVKRRAKVPGAVLRARTMVVR